MPLSAYPRPIPLPLVQQPSAPATITAPRNGVLIVRHYLGTTGILREANRLWVTAPGATREVTTIGAVKEWPGDEIKIAVVAAQEVRVGLNGLSTNSTGTGSPLTTPSKFNDGPNARVEEDDTLPGGWGRYIEWEDLVLDGTNNIFNDSRTLIWFADNRGWVVGSIGRR